MALNDSKLERWLFWSLSAFALLLPISIAVVQPPAYVASVLAIVLMWQLRGSGALSHAFNRPAVFFLIVLVIASALGVRPGTSFGKINRFVILAIAWAMPLVFSTRAIGRQNLARLATLFLVGIALKAGYDFVRVPASMQMGESLFETGNMRDPQFYLAAICLSGGLILSGGWTLRYLPTLTGIVLPIGGLLIHFKRGAWAATLGAIVIMALASRRFKPLLVSAVLIIGLLLAPSVRQRLVLLQSEFDASRGGRLALWTEVAPVIIPAHPLGMGWKAVKHEDFIAIADNVEQGLNHLHNNMLQVMLELSVVGVIAWAWWMLTVLAMFWRGYKRASGSRDPVIAGLSLGGLGAFSGLLLDGMVEYNFGDSEMFMLMVFLMGLAAAIESSTRASEATTPP